MSRPKLGILTLDRKYPTIKGNVASAESYPFQVTIRKVKGLQNPPSPPLRNYQGKYKDDVMLFCDDCREMEKQGVDVIISSCGFFSLLQRVVPPLINIPFYSSPLLLLPLLLNTMNSMKKICLVTLFSEALAIDYFKECGLESLDRIVLTDMSDSIEFRDMIINDNEIADYNSIEEEILNSIENTLEKSTNVGAILLECSDMPPFKNSIVEKFKMPVYDYFSLINMIMMSM